MQHKHIAFICPASIGLSLALLIAGCKPPEGRQHGHSHGHGHGHGHGAADPHEDEEEHPSFPVTVWTNGFEIFAEHQAVIAGEQAEWITHVSSLESGEPRRSGAIKFVVTDAGGASFEHIVSQPSSEGVYLPKINFPKPGDWNVSVRIVEPGSSVEIPLKTVKVHADHAAAHEATVPPSPEGIAFTKENQWKYPTLVRPVGRQKIIERITVSGVIEERPGSRGAVTTPIAGRLLAADSGELPGIGQHLIAGGVVARIEPVFSEISSRLVAARAAVAAAKIKFADAQKTFERVRGLAASGAKSARDLQAAEKEMRLAQSELDSAGALAQAYGLANQGLLTGGDKELPSVMLAAPISGSVVKLAGFATGEFVQEGETVAWTLDVNRVHVHAHVPVSLSTRLSNVTGAEISPAGATGWTPVWNASIGRLVSIGPEVHPETQVGTVIIETENSGRELRVGQQVAVRLLIGQADNVLAVPESALVEEEGLTTVYVQVAGETFQKRIVATGRRDGHWVEIRSGIEAGERVVTRNAYAIRLAAVAGGAIPHSHH